MSNQKHLNNQTYFNSIMKSIFLKKQGDSPKNKVLDFLIVHSDFDYSLKEIATHSGAGYSTIKLLIKKMVKDKWVVATRKISKIKLYKLNINNPEVRKFIEFFWEVIENEVIKGKDKEKIRYSETMGMPFSARNV